MSVAAALTNKLPLVNRALTSDGGVVSDELSPQSVEVIKFAGAGNVGMLGVLGGDDVGARQGFP